jgi:hypothetical protein
MGVRLPEYFGDRPGDAVPYEKYAGEKPTSLECTGAMRKPQQHQKQHQSFERCFV